MTDSIWSVSWFDSGVLQKTMLAWRGVEAQHVVSTMRLVDDADEQLMLEHLLEVSKPPLPAMTVPKHYLLATPFRYRPQHPSRFRRAGTLGLWYGAESLHAACAEVAYWRYRFIMDSVPLLNTDLLTEHTFFQAKVEGRTVACSVCGLDARQRLHRNPGCCQCCTRQGRAVDLLRVRASPGRAMCGCP